ncbi:MAG: PH domain-containing protein [Oscillospiraceae bacterium]|nr:PH domain-containing protein [Oscillospiraceae bacterium]
MKKHSVSRKKLPVSYSVFVVLLFVGMVAILISANKNGVEITDPDMVAPSLVLIVGIISGFCFIFDRPLGRYTVDEEGITTYRGFRTRHFLWEEFVECDIVCAMKYEKETFWVYFSTRHLAEEERKDFLKKGRKDAESVAYFQYEKKLLQEAVQYMPKQFAEKLNYKRMTLCLG